MDTVLTTTRAVFHQGVHFKAPVPGTGALAHCPLNTGGIDLSSPKAVKEKAGFQNHSLLLFNQFKNITRS